MSIQVELLDLMLGLPSPCSCPAPFAEYDLRRKCLVCEWCGGLVESDTDRRA